MFTFVDAYLVEMMLSLVKIAGIHNTQCSMHRFVSNENARLRTRKQTIHNAMSKELLKNFISMHSVSPSDQNFCWQDKCSTNSALKHRQRKYLSSVCGQEPTAYTDSNTVSCKTWKQNNPYGPPHQAVSAERHRHSLDTLPALEPPNIEKSLLAPWNTGVNIKAALVNLFPSG